MSVHSSTLHCRSPCRSHSGTLLPSPAAGSESTLYSGRQWASRVSARPYGGGGLERGRAGLRRHPLGTDDSVLGPTQEG